jgi:putative nucleotidyltransferase with HDIG domain
MPAVLEQLEACLSELEPAWTCRIATDSVDGLKWLAESRFDGVAAPFSLPDMSGVEFLRRAAEISPATVGMLRASSEDRMRFSRKAGLAPHFLPDFCDAQELAAALQRIFELMRWMSGPAVRGLINRMDNLPAMPAIYARVMRELRAEEPSVEAVGKLISQDPALTARMLQMVNSPVFALGRPVFEPKDAVNFLGAERTKSLILIASLSLHGSLTPCEGFSQESFWQHSLAVATMARELALKELKNSSLADACFTAGLLHDIGKLLFASNLPREYGEAIQVAKTTELSVHEAELKMFGVSHGQLGASLLGSWGLPMPVLEAIAWHEHPRADDAPGFGGVMVVHVANALEYEKRGMAGVAGSPSLQMAYLESLGVGQKLDWWRELLGFRAGGEAAKAA